MYDFEEWKAEQEQKQPSKLELAALWLVCTFSLIVAVYVVGWIIALIPWK